MASLVLTVKGRPSFSQTFVDAAVNTTSEAITLPGHNLKDGDVVRFTNSGGALPTGLTSRKHYYVVSAAEGSIKVSETSGGSAVNISAASGGGTHTIRKVATRYDTDLRASGDDKEGVLALRNLCDRILGGQEVAVIDAQTDAEDPVAASGTVTCSSVAVDETLVLAGVTLTAKASPSGEAQFNQAGSDSADASSLADCINAHSTLSKIVSASAASDVVTITCKVKGFIGNFITMSETGSGMTVSGPTLSGGTGGAVSTSKQYSLV